MKQIIIFLLLVIIGIMGYNFYTKWQRFNPPNYHYAAEQTVNENHPDKALLLDYKMAVEQLNGYVITQWGAHNIDVRNPGNDDEQTTTAVAEYNKKLAMVKFFESQLQNKVQEEPKPVAVSEEEKKKELVLKMFNANPNANRLRLGERGALVFEVQRLLIAKGDSIVHDGLFRTETFNALKSFEEKNGLLSDGKLDAITLDYLLR